MKSGETRDLNLKFPTEYDPEVAGKDVVFHVTLNEIKTRILPEIDEDFFEDLGYDKVTNKKELRDEIKKVLEDQKQKELDDEFLDQVIAKATGTMKVEIPDEIIHDEIHRMIHQFEEQLKMQGLKLEQYYQFTGTTEEDMHKNMEPEAIKRIKARYLLEGVAEAESIDVTDEEAQKDAEEMAKNYGISKEELLNAYGSIEVLKYDSKMRKTLKFLQENN